MKILDEHIHNDDTLGIVQECNLGKEFLGRQCCCICKFHQKMFGHPHINGKPISHQLGWACCPPEWNGIYPNWYEHSVGCEMFEKIEEK